MEGMDLPDLYEASISELQRGLSLGHFTSVHLVKAYLARIEEVNYKGPKLCAIIETNPQALEQAARADEERNLRKQSSQEFGILHGIPILVKDNIATKHEEGSHALVGSVVPRDATVVSRLREAGSIILGKTNLSEWANYRGVVPSGWSGRGGQCTSPYYPLLDPSGSSSGSAVAVAIGLAAATLGTETDGSITQPASNNNIVGIKPTVGLTSRAGVIPISSHQDSVGPMTRTVEDAAIILSAIVGPDPLDPVTLDQPTPALDYRKALDMSALDGARLGVPRLFQPYDEAVDTAFNQAIEIMREQGAVIVDPAEFSNADEIQGSTSESAVLAVDFKIDLTKYLDGLKKVPTGVKTLADLIDFNTSHADQELIPPHYADQSQFIASEATSADEEYRAALAANENLGRTHGIDAILKEYNLDAILLPTPGQNTRLVSRVHASILRYISGYSSTPPAIAGYPIISGAISDIFPAPGLADTIQCRLPVPLGFQPEDIVPTEACPIIQNAPGAPFGISFSGSAFSESKLISLAFAYEQATRARLGRRAYKEAIPVTQLRDVMAKFD
ncbi:hypothetical protein HWV62_18830 [Athelia sp. TMB]|nr:hypothetical protein HWV62_18830 [Athelia sp. TMB]